MRNQEELDMALHWFCKEIGVPVNLLVDAHLYQTYIKVKILCDQIGTTPKVLEKGTSWANRSELYIGLLKNEMCKDMCASHSTMSLWDYAIKY